MRINNQRIEGLEKEAAVSGQLDNEVMCPLVNTREEMYMRLIDVNPLLRKIFDLFLFKLYHLNFLTDEAMAYLNRRRTLSC